MRIYSANTMKIRNDFVTNSSSSSFIISNTTQITSKDEIFQKIKTMYLQWISKKNQLIDFCKSNPHFEVVQENGKSKITRTSKDFEVYFQLDDHISEVFGISIFEYLDYDLEWLFCNTYEDYIEFTKNEKYLNRDKKPFIIYDVNDKNENMQDIISWYFPCELTGEYSAEEHCEWCNNNHTKLCHKVKNKETITTDDIKNEIGSVCVFSESGYMPSLVCEALEEMSILHCRHMG